MFRRTKSEPETPSTTDKVGGKGRPTPTRKEAEAAARARAKVPRTRKEQAALARSARGDTAAKMREAMKTGDDRYLPARDRGPVRRFIRDFVDSRFSFIELMIPLLIISMVLGYSGSPGMIQLGNPVSFRSFITSLALISAICRSPIGRVAGRGGRCRSAPGRYARAPPSLLICRMHRSVGAPPIHSALVVSGSADASPPLSPSPARNCARRERRRGSSACPCSPASSPGRRPVLRGEGVMPGARHSVALMSSDPQSVSPLSHERHGVARSCVREDALSVQWESVPCEVTTHVAEGNCVVRLLKSGRRGGEQPEANRQPAGTRTRFGGVQRASLLIQGEAWDRKDRPVARGEGK